ncbi:MAG: hypothetical protein ACLFRB_06695 [Thiohalorhabdus sp.]|uniref:hypothetical protein n=1 Tax=Thiohalorhabdus sp. TaxID=3094134 RepID=UPI00397EBACD
MTPIRIPDEQLEHLAEEYRRRMVAEYLGIPFGRFLADCPRMRARYLEAAEAESRMRLLPAQEAVRDRLEAEGWHQPDPLRDHGATGRDLVQRGPALVEPLPSHRTRRQQRTTRRGRPKARAERSA